MRVGVALNPNAGKGRAAKYRRVLHDVLDMYPIEIDWLPTGTQEESRDAMARATHSGEIDALIIVGGDGFIHNAVNAVGDSGIPLGIVAAGSGNDIAREFGLPIHSIHDSILQIASSLLTQRYHDVDIIEISWKGGSERALAIVSIGIDADANYRTNNLSWPPGNLRYVRGLFGSLANYEPYGVRLTMDGESREGSMTLLAIANTRYFGGGFCISPQASHDDGLLDVVVTPGLRCLDILSLVPQLLLYRHTKDPRVHLYRTTEITVEPDPRFGGELPVIMADGEEICRAPATIRVMPKALKLVM